MKFSSVKWQEEITGNLKQNILNNTFSHALLFCGEHSSAFNLANACADSLLCEKFDGEPCSVCPSCAKTKTGSHPDKIIISSQKSIGVDLVRECIQEMNIRPYGNKKIFIFENGSRLTVQAQNALLKILENPPEYGVIIIVADKEEDLIPTVLSRLKRYTLRIPTGEEIGTYLADKYPEKREMAMFCGKFCEGRPFDAEELLKRDSDFDFRKRIAIFFNKLISGEKSAVFDFANYLTDKKGDFEVFVTYFQAILRDIIFIKKSFPDEKIINSDMLPALRQIADSVTENMITETVKNLTETKHDIDMNASFMLSINNFLLKTREVLNDRNSRSTI